MYWITRVMDEVVSGDFRLDPFGDNQGARGGRFGKNDRELLSTIPRNDIRGPGALPEEFPDLLKRNITGRVSMSVVELFEIVDIDHQERQGVSVPAGTLDFPAQRLVKFPMIKKTRQSISYCHDLHVVVERYHFECKPG